MEHLDCLFVYLSAGPRHRAYLNDCNHFMKCGLIQVAQKEEKYPWSSEVTLECVQDIVGEQIPRTRSESRVAVRAFEKILDRYNPAVVFFGGYDPPFMREFARRTVRSGRVSILMSDSTYHDRPRNPIKEHLKKWILRKIYHGALCSGILSKRYLQHLGFTDSLIWHGVDAIDNEHYASRARQARADLSQRVRLGLPSEYILCVARHSPEKDIDTLLRACAGVFRGRPECRLVLCGTGPMTDDLRQTAEILGLGSRVHFIGWVSYDEMPFYYAYAKVSVLPSISEPWGLVVNESMSCGTPVIASTRCGCSPELIRRGVSGYNIVPGDARELERILCYVLQGVLGQDVIAQCMSVVAPWSIRNQTLGIIDCVNRFGAIIKQAHLTNSQSSRL